MLELKTAIVKYGAATALWDISLIIRAGELVCVVGPNGAGKTTLINVIAGLHRIASGGFLLNGDDVSRLPSHRFCAKGIAIVPEGRSSPPTMPLIPATRPFKSASIAAAMPMMTPPVSADHGVNEVQSIVMFKKRPSLSSIG